MKMEKKRLTNLSLSLDRLRISVLGSLGWDHDAAFCRRFLAAWIALILPVRLVNPDQWKELALSVSKLMELAGDIEEHILKVDVLDEVVF